MSTRPSTSSSVSASTSSPDLLPLDSPLDLVLRGFGQDEILQMTGVDVGYHGSKVRTQLVGVDRHGYRIEHVKQRHASDLGAALDIYRAGGSKVEMFERLGLRGENIIKAKVLFADLDMTDEFKVADGSRRKVNMRQGMLDKYGVDNVFKLEEFQQAAAQTRIDKYGAAYTLDPASSLSEGARETFRENMQDAEFRQSSLDKRQATMQEKYGVSHSMQHADFLKKGIAVRAANRLAAGKVTHRSKPYDLWTKEDFAARHAKYVATSIDRYGVSHHSKTEVHKQTMAAFFDGLSPAERQAMKDKRVNTSIDRHGVPYYTQTPQARMAQSDRMLDAEHQDRVNESKRRNETFNTSKPEFGGYELLVAYFGTDDVQVQYKDDRYPYRCDFYIPSRDLFIEMNGSWTHGPHWYGSNPELDSVLLDQWKKKDTAYYDAAVKQWTISDVKKRASARSGELNYLTVWGMGALDELKLWVAMGAPDAQDWRVEYSWLPEVDLSDRLYDLPELKPGVRRAVQAAKSVNGTSFYAREYEAWSENSYHMKSGTLQSRLFVNRFKYIDKLPNELSTVEILNGLGISGAVRRYTTFSCEGMTKVIDEYKVASIYDPCAGWGERLFTAAAAGVTYLGVDVNDKVVAGHAKMIEQYDLMSQASVVGDSSKVNMSVGSHDAVFTCPPYGNTEIYTDNGAENLTEAEFIIWWSEVVRNSISDSTRVFAYQISQKWKARMNNVLEEAGWTLVKQIPVNVDRVNHFNRARSGKSEFEEVQVFERVKVGA